MLCINCITLSFLYTKRKCIRCGGETVTNISVLCESCSNSERLCTVCLKKVNNSSFQNKNSGCGCGKK